MTTESDPPFRGNLTLNIDTRHAHLLDQRPINISGTSTFENKMNNEKQNTHFDRDHRDLKRFSGKVEDWHPWEAAFTTDVCDIDATEERRLIQAELKEMKTPESTTIALSDHQVKMYDLMTTSRVVHPAVRTEGQTVREYTLAKYTYSCFLTARNKLTNMYMTKFPTQYIKTNADQIKNDPPHVTWASLKQRYKTSTVSNLHKLFTSLQDFKANESTCDRLIDHTNLMVEKLNGTFAKIMEETDDMTRPDKLISEPMHAMILYGSLPEKDFHELQLKPENLVSAREAGIRLKTRYGLTPVKWRTVGTKRGADKITSATTLIAQITAYNKMAKTGGLPTRPPRDIATIICRFCLGLAHYCDPSKDGSMPGCPYKKEWSNRVKDMNDDQRRASYKPAQAAAQAAVKAGRPIPVAAIRKGPAAVSSAVALQVEVAVQDTSSDMDVEADTIAFDEFAQGIEEKLTDAEMDQLDNDGANTNMVSAIRPTKLKMTITDKWCVDSGSGRTITHDKRWFTKLTRQKTAQTMVFPNGNIISCAHSGPVSMTILNKDGLNQPIVLPDCTYAPELDINIISECMLLTTMGFAVTSSSDGFKKTYSKRDLNLTATSTDGVYYFDAKVTKPNEGRYRVNSIQTIGHVELIRRLREKHVRLAHCAKGRLAKLASNGSFPDIPKLDEGTILAILDDKLECTACIENKTARISYKGMIGSRPKVRCHTLHMDTKGPFSIKGTFDAKTGVKHFLTIIDDYTSYKWIFFLKKLTETPAKVIQLIKELDRQYPETKVKLLRADGFRTFRFGKLEAYCKEQGIRQEFSHPHSQEENGGPERYNRTLMETTRALLDTADIPDYMWPNAADYANDILNCLPTARLGQLSPHEVFGLGKPDLNEALTFGCLGFAHIPVKSRDDKSLSPRMHKCKLLGYSKEFKGYKVLDMTTRKILNVRQFRTHKTHEIEITEGIFTSKITEIEKEPVYGSWPHIDTDETDDNDQQTKDDSMQRQTMESVGVETGVVELQVEPTVAQTVEHTVRQKTKDNTRPKGSVGVYTPRHTESVGVHHKTTKDTTSPLGSVGEPIVTTRKVIVGNEASLQPNMKLPNTTTIQPRSKEEIARLSTAFENTLQMLTRSKAKSRLTTPTTPAGEDILVNAITQLDAEDQDMIKSKRQFIPKTYKEAVNCEDSKQWREAIEKELTSLQQKMTWKMTKLPAGRKALPSKWVFDVKYNPDGSIERYKARLVIQGFRQIYGVDYDETFAPVARYESLKMILAMSTILDLEVHQMDVCTAFLNGELLEEIYMLQPDGQMIIDDDGTKMVCRLLKSLYGLKQAGRIWYKMLHDYLTANGFTRCNKEYCLYVQRDDDGITMIVVYVDDLTIAASSTQRIKDTKDALSKRFEMKDLGEIKYLLKIEIERNRKEKTMTLSQRKYIHDILDRFDMLDASAALTPQVHGQQLFPETTLTPDQVKLLGYPFPELIGALLHLARGTRPDIANACRVLSKFLTRHNETHWIAALRVLRYLKGTSNYGLVFDGKLVDAVTYQLFSDASFANTDDDRQSVTGYCVMMAGGPISTKSTKQGNITISTAEAELVACSDACRESEWIWFLLEELGYKQTKPILIHCDNTSVVAIAKNPGNHNGTKHIEIRHLYVRHLIDQGRAEIKYCWTEDMIADILTKAVPTRLFLKLRDMMGVKLIIRSGSVGI